MVSVVEERAARRVLALRLDVAILDARSPDGNGIDVPERAIPRSRLVTLPGAGYLCWIECAGEVNELIDQHASTASGREGSTVITRAAVLSRTGATRPYARSEPLTIEELRLAAPGDGEVLVRVGAAGPVSAAVPAARG